MTDMLSGGEVLGREVEGERGEWGGAVFGGSGEALLRRGHLINDLRMGAKRGVSGEEYWC